MCIRSGSFAKLLRWPFHDFLHCTLCVTQGHRIESIRPIGPPVHGVTSTANPALWPCTFCSDRIEPFDTVSINSVRHAWLISHLTKWATHLMKQR